MDYDLLVIGDANPDVILTGDVTPEFGQIEKIVESGCMTIGGSASIVAAGAARLGLRTALVAVVGDDLLGHAQIAALRDRGVDTSSVKVDPSRPTGLGLVLSQGDDRAILTAVGTIDALSADMVDRELLGRSRHVHVASYFLQPHLRPGLPDLLRAARAAGASTSLDTNWDPSGSWDAALEETLPLVDVFLPNLAEACALTGMTDAEAAVERLARTADTVAVKLGADGALARQGANHATAEPISVDVVDTTGAGDSFDAGFLFGRLQGWPLDRSLALACACGSLSTQAVGGVDAQPTLDTALAAAG
jgi:sugar/nucleoside kinase (ribokinase family)